MSLITLITSEFVHEFFYDENIKFICIRKRRDISKEINL